MTTDEIYVQLSVKPPFLSHLLTLIPVELLTNITDILVYFHIGLKSITSFSSPGE